MKPKLDAALYMSLGRWHYFSCQWAAPVVPVLKSDNTIRVCGDYKLTANKVIKSDTNPIPKPEDLFSSVSGGKIFSK